ncbi:MAG: TadE family protein [Angustibacter sp.]
MTRPAGDGGSAAVDFALVGGLLTMVFMSVVQLGLALHVRATLVDCVAEAARAGALSGRSPSDSGSRLRQLVAAELGAGYASRVRVAAAERTTVGEVEVVTVTVSAPAPVVGLAGPSGRLTVTAHALTEPR